MSILITDDEQAKKSWDQFYDLGITNAMLIVIQYRDQILPEAFDEIIERLKTLKSDAPAIPS